MQVIIFGNQITGILPIDKDPSTLPIGYTISEYPEDVAIESLYYDNGNLNLIPPAPDGGYNWNGRVWLDFMHGPNWEGLLSDLRCSEVWAKSFVAASSSLPANAAWTVLYSTLTGISRSLPDLMYAVGALRLAMIASGEGDFTDDQVVIINTIMINRGFPKI